MGMSQHVVGFREPDEKFEQMKLVYDACESAGVDIPSDVLEFFEYEKPDDSGVKVDLEKYDCVSSYNEDGQWGFEVNLEELPENVSYIRFFCSV